MSTTTQQRLRSASKSTLPLVSVVDDSDLVKRVAALLKKAVAASVRQSEAESEQKEIKAELAAICAAYDLPGFRHGLNGFEYHGYQTRKTLSKERLLAAGVSAEVIAEAYIEGEPFLYSKIVAFDIE